MTWPNRENIMIKLLKHLSVSLAPKANEKLPEDIVASASPLSLERSRTNDAFLIRYFSLLVLLVIFWPVLLTLLAASVSASAWLFWLLIGAVVGLLQLLFVLYNFIMITWDLGVLTLLKSFAFIRCYVRYYTYKMTNAAGLETRLKNKHGKITKRRRKEWREEVETAKSYDQFCLIELYEPHNSVTVDAPKYQEMSTSCQVDDPLTEPSSSPTSGVDLSTDQGQRNDQIEHQIENPNSPTSQLHLSPTSSSGSPMRKIHSCLDFKISVRNLSNCGRSSGSQTVKRTSSSTSLPSDRSQDELNDEEDYLRYQKIVRDDLGMTGDMILATMARLKEARVQASCALYDHFNFRKNFRPVSNVTCAVDPNHEKGESLTKAPDNMVTIHSLNHLVSSPTTVKGSRDDHASSLKFLLSGIIKRNHLSLDDALINDCRSVAERGQHSLRKETRDAIDRYGEEVESCMDWLASGPLYLDTVEESTNPLPQIKTLQPQKNDTAETLSPVPIIQRQLDELNKRYTLVKRMKQNMGHTALMLSGGGAIAMYHLGTIKALVESGLYEAIHVISGTSGGSIAAAMCAIKSPEDLLRDICVNTVSTDYMLTGEMKQKNIRWFPELLDMGKYWLKHGVLADSAEFKRCCDFYYKDITFEEAFEMTHKHVCITVTASRASAGSGVQRLLLNHISTPNVTLASAVAASCSLPGFMKPTKLMIKDGNGKQVPFEVDGVEWIDGSVQADLPFKRISTLFNVSNYVVAQVNFHVVPFLNKAHHPNINTLYWKLFQMCMWDIRSRVLNLSQLGLFPRLFGQDMTKVFKQKYYGNLTLVPRFTTMQIFGLKAFQNPTIKDMDIYLQDGQIAAWPYLRVLSEMLRIERTIDRCLIKLKNRIQSLETGSDHPQSILNEDADSLSQSSTFGAACRARLPGLSREAELLKEKNIALKQENVQLRRQVARLQRALGISPTTAMVSATESFNECSLLGRFVSVSRVDEEEYEDQSRLEEKKCS